MEGDKETRYTNILNAFRAHPAQLNIPVTEPQNDFYMFRNAMMGSTRAARRAGI